MVACCHVPALWLGIHVAQWEGVSPRLLQPLSVPGSCTPTPVLHGHHGGLAQPEGWVGGQSCAGLQSSWSWCLWQGCSPHPAMLGTAPASPTSLASVMVAEWCDKLCPALPAAHSALFQPNVLYEIVILLEINYRGGALPRRAWSHASWQCLPPWECIYHGDFLRL